MFSKQNPPDLIERLYEKRDQQQQQQQQQDFPFKPALNAVSLELAANRSLDDLIQNDYAR
jgi:hypothetical protein